MHVAVTGASGFIGRYVAAELARRETSPVILSRSPAGRSPDLSAHRSVTFDLKVPPADSFKLLGEPDVLLHLAWGGLPNYRSAHHMDEELPSQFRFLRGLIEHGLKHLVVAGTCLEYGMQSGALHEGMETRPTNSYAQAKDALRRQLQGLQKVRPFALTWARLFYTYGDGQSPTSIWSQLKRAVEQGASTFDMSGGEQVRDYMPVQDVASALVTLALSQRDHGCVNICSGNPVSVGALVEGWVKEHGWTIKLNRGHYPYPDYEPMAFWGDPEKLNSFAVL